MTPAALSHPFWREVCQHLQRERYSQAEPLIASLRNKFPEQPEFLYADAFVAQHTRKFDRAVELYALVINNETSPGDWHINYGVSLLELQRNREAEVQFAYALNKNPKFPDFWLLNYCMALSRNRKNKEAEAAFRILLQRAPNYVEALEHCARHYVLAEKFVDSLPFWERLCELNPAKVSYQLDLTTSLVRARRFGDALEKLEGLRARQGATPGIVLNQACSLLGLHRTDEAWTRFEEALELAPDDLQVIGAAIGYLQIHGMHDKSAALLERGLDNPKRSKEFRYFLATRRLRQGDFDGGWALYRERWGSKHFRKGETQPDYEVPEWRGESLEGKNLLVADEQGLADKIQYLSMLPDLLAKGARVAWETDARLVPLAKRSFPDVLFFPFRKPRIHPTDMPFDYYISAGDLGGYLRRSLDDFKGRPAAFLVPDPEAREKWQERLAAIGKPGELRIAVCWRSTRSKELYTGLTYPPLEHWINLIKSFPNSAWISLQYDEPGEDIIAIEDISGVKLYGWTDLNVTDQQDALSALLAEVDLVIAPATAPVFLADAVGGRTFSIWQDSLRIYWKTHGLDHLPWAPDMKLFMRSGEENWETVFERLADAIREIPPKY